VFRSCNKVIPFDTFIVAHVERTLTFLKYGTGTIISYAFIEYKLTIVAILPCPYKTIFAKPFITIK
jgi:hypothetical protein